MVRIHSPRPIKRAIQARFSGPFCCPGTFRPARLELPIYAVCVSLRFICRIDRSALDPELPALPVSHPTVDSVKNEPDH